jgi:hypothetical protein
MNCNTATLQRNDVFSCCRTQQILMENYFEITKIIPIFAAMLLTNIPKNMTTECINPQLPVFYLCTQESELVQV